MLKNLPKVTDKSTQPSDYNISILSWKKNLIVPPSVSPLFYKQDWGSNQWRQVSRSWKRHRKKGYGPLANLTEQRNFPPSNVKKPTRLLRMSVLCANQYPPTPPKHNALLYEEVYRIFHSSIR